MSLPSNPSDPDAAAATSAHHWLAEMGAAAREEFRATRRVMGYAEYLDAVAAEPRLHLRSACQYVVDAIDCFGTYEVETPRGKVQRFRIFDGQWDPSGEDRLVGQEHACSQLYGWLRAGAREGSIRKVLLLHGPNGSAKSTLLRSLGRGLEEYSHRAEGALYRLSWVFPRARMGRGGIGFGGGSENESLETFAHLSDDQVDARLMDELRDHPLLALPVVQRQQYLASLRVTDRMIDHVMPDHLERGGLSAKNRAIFDALLSNYHGDVLKVLRHLRVERFYIDHRQRVGYVTVEPQMSIDAHERQITADRSVSALPASLQTVALYEYGGELVGANRGIIEYDDLLKRPLESYKYLLTTVERAAISLPSALLGLDVVYLASSNESHVAAFKEYQDFPSFKGRFEFIRVPYLLSVTEEQRLYERRLQEAAAGRHVAPHVAYALALFAVMTRMRRPQAERYPEHVRDQVSSLTPLAKADLYTHQRVPAGVVGESAKQLRSLVKELVSESDGYPNYEGKYGASPRELLGVLLAAAGSPRYPYVSPLVVIDELAALIQQTSLYEYLRLEPVSGGFHDYAQMLEAVRDRVAEKIELDVRAALGLVESSEHARVFERYMSHVMHWVRGEKIRNTATGQMEEPDEALMAEVERSLATYGEPGHAKRYREGLVTKVGAWSVENPGRKPTWDVIFAEELQRLADSYFEKSHQLVAAGVNEILVSLAHESSRQDGEYGSSSEVVKRLLDLGYTAQSARDLVGFLMTRRFR